MLRRIITLALVAGTAASLQAKPENYKIDPVHSFITFRISHMGIGQVFGRFNDLSGTFTLDNENPANDKIGVEVKTDSLDTKNGKRDEDVKSPNLLNAAQFPLMSFQSDSVKKLDQTHYELTGKLTIHGVTKPLTMKLEKTGEKDMKRGGHRAAGTGSFTIKRSDFGMGAMSGMIGDDVNVTVAIEGNRQ